MKALEILMYMYIFTQKCKVCFIKTSKLVCTQSNPTAWFKKAFPFRQQTTRTWLVLKQNNCENLLDPIAYKILRELERAHIFLKQLKLISRKKQCEVQLITKEISYIMVWHYSFWDISAMGLTLYKCNLKMTLLYHLLRADMHTVVKDL